MGRHVAGREPAERGAGADHHAVTRAPHDGHCTPVHRGNGVNVDNHRDQRIPVASAGLGSVGSGDSEGKFGERRYDSLNEIN